MRKTCLDMVYELAKLDPRVVFIGSDLGPGVLENFRDEFPDRFFMEGVSEANIIGISAGLALDGFIPYVNTIATFLTRRCFEQVAMDLCLHNLPVRLIANGGGLVYAPLGPTHIAIDDIALMRTLPNMSVVCPSDAREMKRFMSKSLTWKTPLYIRLGKGSDPIVSRETDDYKIGESILLREPKDVLIIASGVMVGRAIVAAELLSERSISTGVLNMHTIKPLDEYNLKIISNDVAAIVTLDEHLLAGGLGSAVLECLNDDRLNKTSKKIFRIGIQDQFTQDYGSQDSLMESFGLQPDQIADSVENMYRNI
jgi:transketolase